MKTILMTLAAVAVFGWLGLRASETTFYRWALPEQLGTTGFVSSGSDANVLAMQREACGAVVYRLDAQTKRMIELKGLAFFEDARQGRGYVEGRKRDYYHYEPWQETGRHLASKGRIGIGLDCGGFSEAWSHEVWKAAMQPGSFFTLKSEATLLVIPRMSLIVLEYQG